MLTRSSAGSSATDESDHDLPNPDPPRRRRTRRPAAERNKAAATAPVLREIDLWARYRAARDDASLLALAELMRQERRSLPPLIEFQALRAKAELGTLSQDEAPRLLTLRERLGQPLSLRCEMILLDRLLDRDPSDLNFLRRFRDLKYQLGEPVDPAREELALRADLLLDPQNGAAAHRLSRVIDAQGKAISGLVEEKALFVDLAEVPGDADCSIRLGRVLGDQAKPVPAEVEEAALRHIVEPGADEGERAVRLCKILASRRRLVPAWMERMAVAYCGQDYRGGGDDTLRDLASEYNAILSRWCANPGRPAGLLICNSIPKSGTHLLSQFVRNVGDWRYSRLHLHDRFATVDYTGAIQETPSNVILAEPLELLPGIASGHFATAHLKWSIEIELQLAQAPSPVKMAMVYRDPRDTILSQMRWETYSEVYPRISEGNLATRTRMRELDSDGERLSDLLERMLSGEADAAFLDYFGWLRWPDCLAVAFEISIPMSSPWSAANWAKRRARLPNLSAPTLPPPIRPIYTGGSTDRARLLSRERTRSGATRRCFARAITG
jgi:hypothetical protein